MFGVLIAGGECSLRFPVVRIGIDEPVRLHLQNRNGRGQLLDLGHLLAVAVPQLADYPQRNSLLVFGLFFELVVEPRPVDRLLE